MRTFSAALVVCILLSCPALSEACTSLCLQTPDGPFFATNLDLVTSDGHLFVNRRGIAKESYHSGLNDNPAQWASSYGSVTFNLVGRELPWGGMNEAGLVISTMQLMASRCPDPDERLPFGEASFVQYLLDTCADVAEVIEAVSGVRLAQHECASHYLVADESGGLLAIEFLDGQTVLYSGDDLPLHAMANATYASGVAFKEQGIVPADNPGASVERMADACAMMDEYSPETDGSPSDYLMTVLTETVVAPKKWYSNLFGEPYTRWNIVFDITGRSVRYRTVDNTKIRSFSLAGFDFSCESPLLMLDVNAKLEGNIEPDFGPYDHDANLKIFREFCDKWGIEVSQEDSEALIKLFEGFRCTS